MPEFFTTPRVSVLARPSFAEPAHLPVHWLGDSTDGERLAEFAGRLCYMSQKNPANRNTRDYLENIKKQGHGSVLEHATYSLLLEGVSRSLTHELVYTAPGLPTRNCPSGMSTRATRHSSYRQQLLATKRWSPSGPRKWNRRRNRMSRWSRN